MLIQIHFLQNYAPANLNRDDTGSPKDTLFGGTRRGRISSQCLKRSIRRSTVFAEAFGSNGLLGMRTKLLPDQIGKELQAMGVDDKTIKAIVEQVPKIGRKMDKNEQPGEETSDKGEPELATRQLIFIGQNELRPLAEKLLALYTEHGPKQWVKLDLEPELQGSVPRSVDIAMFGRMTTSEAFEDMQAAIQVAHALSTNALTQEFDYYTAVDDLSGESGAGMIGDIEFNSSNYYKYFSVHWEKLIENLGGDEEIAQQAVLALVEAAAMAQPSGKQNSFAAHNLPDLILIEVRARNLPVSYANAFLKPARPTHDKSIVDVAVDKLNDYMTRVGDKYNLNGKRAFVALQEEYTLPNADAQPSLNDLKEWLKARLAES